MTLSKFCDGVYISVDGHETVKTLDSIIFDCDGVLIDITKSYDLAIQQTTNHVLKEFANICCSTEITSEIIDGFKATGGFNDEVDLTYALILSIYAATKLKENITEFIFKAIENSNESGIKSTEKYLEKIIDISDIKNKLNYPGKQRNGHLYSIFDQLFYGPDLYLKIFKKNSKFSGPGLINNDKVILDMNLISKLKKIFSNKIAIVTGRGFESIRFPLKDLLNEFDIENSAFLEDEPRYLAKPNPQVLIRSISGLKSKHCLYVGDSMEDFIMAHKATKLGRKTTFCGIIGTSKNPQRKLKLFEENNVTIVLDSINLLPKVLNQV